MQDNVKVQQELEAVKNPEWALGNTRAPLRDKFYRTLLITPFEDFATKRAYGRSEEGDETKDDRFDSVEAIHDLVHRWVGGDPFQDYENKRIYSGHMANVPYAAFDPIFWFHHWYVSFYHYY
jgi:Common central domain of tyrosinase